MYINYKCNQLCMYVVVIKISPEQTALHCISVLPLAVIEVQL